MKFTLPISLTMLAAPSMAQSQLLFEEQATATTDDKKQYLQDQVANDDPLAWRNKSLSADERATLLINAMTFHEKAAMMTNNIRYDHWTGSTKDAPRVKVPEIRYSDNGQGFMSQYCPDTTTQWPVALAMGMTWDPEFNEEWGAKMAVEHKAKGAGVWLGPMMNMMRQPLNGRDFELLTGEDPYVGEILGPATVRGVQNNGVVATLKAFVNYNQELNRIGQNNNIDERTQMEMYMPPWEACVKAEVGSTMCSYNKINHIQTCANPHTLNYQLRGLFGFDGFVMSDWGAVLDRPKAYVSYGCDQEMTGGPFLYNETAIYEDLTTEQLDTAIHRITRTFIKWGLYEEQLPDNYYGNVTTQENFDFAQMGVEKSTTLLKNKDKTLPFSFEKGKNYLVLGDAGYKPVVHGGGSGGVYSTQVYPPIHALADRLGVDKSAFTEFPFGMSCNETTGNCLYYLGVGSHNWGYNVDPYRSDQDTQKSDSGKYDSFLNELKSMEQFEATFAFFSTYSQENTDRSTLKVNPEFFEFIKKVPNKGKLITMVTAPGPVLIKEVAEISDALVFNVFPGKMYSLGVMKVVFGEVNPSAKLLFTMPNIENEMNMTIEQWPGLDNGWNTTFTEKHHFGYRWYDQYNVTPAWEFGFGMSYSSFEYKNLQINKESRNITFEVANNGSMKGDEIAQIYISVPETENFYGGWRSPKVLKGFYKFKDLSVNETKSVDFQLPARAFSYWSVKDQKWIEEKGTYGIMVGASSRDIRLKGTITIG